MSRKSWPFIFLLVVLTAISCKRESQDSRWKGQVIIEDGIKVVKNPADPKYGNIEFTLTEGLSIGNEEDENYLFFRTYRLNVDNRGNVYVVDRGNQRVQVFDREGKYLRTIGRGGQGPGEFGYPAHVLIDELGNEIYVPEEVRPNILVFSMEGTYRRSIPIKGRNRSYCVSPGGSILVEREVRDTAEKHAYLASLMLIDSTDGSEMTIDSRPDQLAKVIEGAKAGFSHGYEHRFQFDSLGAQRFIYGFSSDYEINVIDSKGNLLFKIQKESPEIPLSKEEKDIVRDRYRESPIKNVNNIPFPDHRPHYGKIHTDGDWIFVSHYESPQEQKAECSMDVFSSEGYLMYTCTFPIQPLLIKDGCVYLIETSDETGDIRIKRYRVVNWRQLKDIPLPVNH